MQSSPNLLSLGLEDKHCPAGTGQWVVKYVRIRLSRLSRQTPEGPLGKASAELGLAQG